MDGKFKVGDQGTANDGCREATSTPAGVAKRLRTFHEITDQDLHDLYDFVDCGTRGRILLDGKTYYWSLYITDVMDTTYPDGRLKWIAGKPNPIDP
jgi:hypothetical protein